LDLAVPSGGVFGFLGPNGSGKTTTIRCLLGLVRPTGGDLRIFGTDPRSELHRVIGKIGSIVETPTFFPGFSGKRNLELLARVGGIDHRRVGPTLERVGLADRSNDLFKNYSLGMKQRLGIAGALLKDPELLLLDEPANGLDPAGIREVRELLRRLAGEGRTVFVSSHHLPEVQQVCDSVAILSRGRCVAAGAVSEVLASRGAEGLLVRVDDLRNGVEALHAAGIHATVENHLIRASLPATEGARVSKALADAGLYPSELRPDEADLETVFLELTAGEQPS
jgi:ABC-2 type transport system ATP-binding protein